VSGVRRNGNNDDDAANSSSVSGWSARGPQTRPYHVHLVVAARSHSPGSQVRSNKCFYVFKLFSFFQHFSDFLKRLLKILSRILSGSTFESTENELIGHCGGSLLV